MLSTGPWILHGLRAPDDSANEIFEKLWMDINKIFRRVAHWWTMMGQILRQGRPPGRSSPSQPCKEYFKGHCTSCDSWHSTRVWKVRAKNRLQVWREVVFVLAKRRRTDSSKRKEGGGRGSVAFGMWSTRVVHLRMRSRTSRFYGRAPNPRDPHGVFICKTLYILRTFGKERDHHSRWCNPRIVMRSSSRSKIRGKNRGGYRFCIWNFKLFITELPVTEFPVVIWQESVR